MKTIIYYISLLLKAYNISKIRSYKSIEGWLSDDEAWGLYKYASNLNPGGLIVEIGSWKGKSTYCLAKGLTSNSKIIAIDPFDGYGEKESIVTYSKLKANVSNYQIFIDNLTSRGVVNKVIPKIGYSRDFVDTIDKIDFLFIDGDHSIKGCKFDFEKFSPKVISGGFVAFHDYRPEQKNLGPVQVIEKIVLKDKSYKFVDLFDSLWIAQKV